MLSGTYVGLLRHLHGQHALLQEDNPNGYLVQFDARNLSRFGPDEPEDSCQNLGFGWHFFWKNDFKLDCKEEYKDKLELQYEAVMHHLTQR